MNSFLSPFGAVVLLAVTGVVEGGGSFGAFCSIKHACENGGTCDPTGNNVGLCTCPTGFSGYRCQTECSTSADCMNGATCQREACTCAPGFTGGKCESMTAPAVVSGDVCSSADPCANGGTCNTTVTGGACSCPTGYEGKRCQAACNTNADCKNKGTCESRGCKCTAGYTGGKCESMTAPAVVSGDVCSSAHPCANGGTCNTTVTGGVCSCPTGYEGKRCQAGKQIQSTSCNTNADCKNKGTCESRGCKCTAGYTGGKCESVLSGADQVIAFPAAVLMYVVVQLSLKV